MKDLLVGSNKRNCSKSSNCFDNFRLLIYIFSIETKYVCTSVSLKIFMNMVISNHYLVDSKFCQIIFKLSIKIFKKN